MSTTQYTQASEHMHKHVSSCLIPKWMSSVFAILLLVVSTQLHAQTGPGEADVIFPEAVSGRHEIPIIQPTEWLHLLDTAGSPFFHLHPFPVFPLNLDPATGGQSVVLPSADWLNRYTWDLDGQFPSIRNPSLCVHWSGAVSGSFSPGNEVVDNYAKLNIDPLFGPEPPTLPARSIDIVSSSSPLVPSGIDSAYRPMLPTAQRSTIGNTLDLVTGTPLLQAIDLELPFGGATFRHVRTYANSLSIFGTIDATDDRISDHLPQTRLWDWHGIGWMVGHNPILLIDGSYPGIAANTLEDDASGNTFFPRRSYFIPDAHRSIPFDMVVSEGPGDGWTVHYEAPARFGAHMQPVEGKWEPDLHNGLGGWEVFPLAYEVWLNEGAVKYTIVPIYEDIRNAAAGGVTGHDRVPSSSFDLDKRKGAPYLGLAVQIEDQYGNRIINEFCGVHQYDCSLPDTAPGLGDPTDTHDPGGSASEPGVFSASTQSPGTYPPSRTLCQSCHRKGQLHRTYLYAAGEDNPTWTIVYSHRTFLAYERDYADSEGNPRPPSEKYFPYASQSAIQTIRVYEGAPASEAPDSCLTVDFRAFHPNRTAESFRGFLDVDPAFPVGYLDGAFEPSETWEESALSNADNLFEAILGRLELVRDIVHPSLDAAPYGSDWVHEVRYVYSDASDLFTENQDVFPASLALPFKFGSSRRTTPRLLTAIKRTRADAGDAVETSAYVYRYADEQILVPDWHLSPRYNDTGIISAVFDPIAVESLFDAYQQTTGEYTSIEELALALIIEDGDRAVPVSDKGVHFTTNGILDRDIRSAASQYFGLWHSVDNSAAGQDSSTFQLPGVRRASPQGQDVGDRRSFGDLRYPTGLSGFMSSGFLDEMVDFVGVPSPTDDLVVITADTGIFADGTAGHSQRVYKMYRFLHLPPATDFPVAFGRGIHKSGWHSRAQFTSGSDSGWLDPHRAIWHFPHQLLPANWANWSSGGVQNFPVMAKVGEADHGLNRPLWYAVIGEYPSLWAALVPVISATDPSGFGNLPRLDDTASTVDPDLLRYKPESRRVVALNAMGYVVWERRYDVGANGVALADGTGYRMESIYDDQGRVIMEKSYGWSAAELAGNEASEGLVTVYDYDYEVPEAHSMFDCAEPRRIGIQYGDNGDQLDHGKIQWLAEFYRDAERPEVVLAEVTFDDVRRTSDGYVFPKGDQPLLPVHSYAAVRNVVIHEVEFDSSVTFGPAKAIKKKLSATAPVPHPDDPATGLWAVSGQVMDEESGQVIFSGRGLVVDPEGPGADGRDVFSVDWTVYDHRSRPVLQVEDIDGSKGGYDHVFDDDTKSWGMTLSLAGWTPRSSEASFLEYVTAHDYAKYGLKQTQYPDLRRRYIKPVWVTLGDQHWVERYDLTGMPVLSGSSPVDGEFQSEHTEITKTVTSGVRAEVVYQRVAPDSQGVIDVSDLTTLLVQAEIDPEYDPSGKPSTVTLETAGAPSFDLESTYIQFGTVSRRKSANGTITRQVHDELGRLIRTYRGTDDWSSQFGAPPDTPGSDDLGLIETRIYGEGVHNATLPTIVRSYREQPVNVYDPDLSQIEKHGSGEAIGYDWRMRDVVRVRFERGVVGGAGDANGEPLSVLVSHLDASGRAIFEAEYDSSVLTSFNAQDPAVVHGLPNQAPALRSAPITTGTLVPTASELLGHSALRRLTQFEYDARGNMSRTLDFDLESGTATDFLATETYHDQDGRPLRVLTPGGGRVEIVYDARGREHIRRTYAAISLASTAADVPVSETVTSYTSEGSPSIITTRVRVDGDQNPTPLDHTNSIETQTQHWYKGDVLVCTAEFGTGRSDNLYASHGGSPDWPTYNELIPPISVTGGVFTLPSSPSAYDDALLAAYGYDAAGNREFVLQPSGNVTRTVYDGWGNAFLVQEGMTLSGTGRPVSPQRATVYRYDRGRISEVIAITDSSGPELTQATYDPAPTWQPSSIDYLVTKIEYEADVLSWDGTAFRKIGENNEWIRAIQYPDSSGAPSPADAMVFQYYPDGSIATRTDQRGVKFSYFYDDLDRHVGTLVAYPDVLGEPFDGSDTFPADRIDRVTYAYDDATGLLITATAYGTDGSGSFVVAESSFEYDKSQRLVEERQHRGDHTSTASPAVGYAWDFSATQNSSRLDSITYPERLDTAAALTLGFVYGTAGDVENVLDRITRINAGDGSTPHQLASFAYDGGGMVVRRATHGPTGLEIAAEGQDDAESAVIGYEHLDRFGRRTDLHWRSPTALQYRAIHTLDTAGNRTSATVTRVDGAGLPVADTHDWLFDFDDLQRLIRADLGDLDLGSGPPTISSAVATHAWTLDSLGNWAGDGASTPGLARVEGSTVNDLTHNSGAFNRISSAKVHDGTSAVTTAFVYDLAGNLVFDGEYWYRYDAWHRLIQVVEALPGMTFSDDGVLLTPTTFAQQDVVAVFSYDALGRLVGRQAPWPGVADEWRYETYLYDGDRRIAERWDDPLFNSNNGGNNANQPPQVSGRVVRTEREYVYTPGYIDEFIAEYDSTGDYWPILQDANFNAVAMTDDAGVVVRQRVFSPYGRLLTTESLTSATPPKSRLGHQGLFVERLDASTLATSLASGSVLAWHNRNRTLLSEHGRFAQRDPNASGQGTRGSLNQSGSAIFDTLAAADPLGLFGDGGNIYGYAQASPTQWQDPSGLIAGMLMPGPSDFVTGALEGLVRGYSDRLSFDVEWATDWDAGDDWHTRSDNRWVMAALGMGLYDAFYLGIPGTGIGFNPLDVFAGRYVPGQTFPASVRKKVGPGQQAHHIATVYGEYGVEFRKLFDRADMKMNDPGNAAILDLSMHPNGQNHSKVYHDEVLKRLSIAMLVEPGSSQLRKGDDAAKALKNALDDLRRDIESGQLPLR